MVTPTIIEYLTKDNKVKRISIERVEPFEQIKGNVLLRPAKKNDQRQVQESDHESDSDDDEGFSCNSDYSFSYPSTQYQEPDTQHTPDRLSPSNIPLIPFLQQLPLPLSPLDSSPSSSSSSDKTGESEDHHGGNKPPHNEAAPPTQITDNSPAVRRSGQIGERERRNL